MPLSLFCYVASVSQSLRNSTNNLIFWRVYQPVLFIKKKMHSVCQRTATVGQSGSRVRFPGVSPWSLVVYHLHMGKPVGPRSGQNVTQNSGKFRPGIAFTVCTNQFYLPKNDHESLKLVSKMALRKWNTRNIPSGKKGLVTNTFSDVLLLPEIFRWSDPNRRAPFRISRKLSVNGQQPLFQILFLSM